MAAHQFADNGGSEADHGHPAVEALNAHQGGGVPGSTGGQSFAEGLERFVAIAVVWHDWCPGLRGDYAQRVLVRAPCAVIRPWPQGVKSLLRRKSKESVGMLLI